MAIEIPELPQISHGGKFFRDGWISAMLCGKSGCGKTRLMAEMVPDISPNIKFICIATMVYRNPFHLAVKDWCERNGKICVISEDPEKIRNFVSLLHKSKWLVPGKQEMLVIFDDFSIHHRSGSKYENLVVEAFTRWRNLGVNFIIVCQDASMVATSCRNCTNIRILFNSASKTALHTFSKDVFDRLPDPRVYTDMIKYISSVPFSYILIQDNPLTASIGKGTELKKIMTESSVIVPNHKEIMNEMGASSEPELTEVTTNMQIRMGNNAPELTESPIYKRPQSSPDAESDSDDEG